MLREVDSNYITGPFLHSTRIDYNYIIRKEHQLRHEAINIFSQSFKASIARINPTAEACEIEKRLKEISLKLDYDNLGREFLRVSTAASGIRLIGSTTLNNNSFQVTKELTYDFDFVIEINGLKS